jgi:hypothetical protein
MSLCRTSRRDVVAGQNFGAHVAATDAARSASAH